MQRQLDLLANGEIGDAFREPALHRLVGGDDAYCAHANRRVDGCLPTVSVEWHHRVEIIPWLDVEPILETDARRDQHIRERHAQRVIRRRVGDVAIDPVTVRAGHGIPENTHCLCSRLAGQRHGQRRRKRAIAGRHVHRNARPWGVRRDDQRPAVSAGRRGDLVQVLGRRIRREQRTNDGEDAESDDDVERHERAPGSP